MHDQDGLDRNRNLRVGAHSPRLRFDVAQSQSLSLGGVMWAG